MEFVVGALLGIFNYIFDVVCWYSLVNKKIDFKDYKLYLFGLVFMILGNIISIYFSSFFKMILLTALLCFIAYYLVFKKFKTALFATLVVQLVMMISEVTFVLLLSLLKVDLNYVLQHILGQIVLNICVTLLALSTLKIKLPHRLYKVFCDSSDNLKTNNIFKYTLIMIIVASFFTSISYTRLPSEYILIINTGFVILYIIIMFCLSKTQNKYEKVSSKYNSSIKSLEEYENMIEKYRVSNHESKAELNRILEMVSRNDPDTVKHIEAMLNTRIKENEKIMKKNAKIPSGGLRATIYSKMCIMEDKGINNKLIIAKNVKTSELLSLDETIILNICKILGVYFDNAIEAVEHLNDKNILIEIYKDDSKLFISITNNFKGQIDLKSMDKAGYTTKGNDHGYGLSLVHEIVSSDSHLSSERSINNNLITHTLIIGLK